MKTDLVQYHEEYDGRNERTALVWLIFTTPSMFTPQASVSQQLSVAALTSLSLHSTICYGRTLVQLCCQGMKVLCRTLLMHLHGKLSALLAMQCRCGAHAVLDSQTKSVLLKAERQKRYIFRNQKRRRNLALLGIVHVKAIV